MTRSLLKIVAVITGSVILCSCGGEQGDGPNPVNAPVPVNLFTVRTQKPVWYEKFPATVVAAMQVDIRPVAEGYITGIFFSEGSHVQKGQKLYSIDDIKYQATYSQAQANVKVAVSNLDQAQKDADRYLYLHEHDAVAKQLLDHALTSLQNAKNQVTAAKQDLAKASTDLNYSTVRAPFDGIIGISQVKVGNTVVPGQTVLNTISTDAPMFVDFTISEKQIPRFAKLHQRGSKLKDSLFTLLLPDNSLYEHPGTISLIDRGVNPQTGTLLVRLKFPNPSSTLKAGMSAIVRLRNEDTSPQILVPARAAIEQMGEYFVYIAKDTLIPVIDEEKKQNSVQQKSMLHALQRKVTLGQTIADQIIVKSGLQNDDVLIVDGIQKLHDGSLITISNSQKNK